MNRVATCSTTDSLRRSPLVSSLDSTKSTASNERRATLQVVIDANESNEIESASLRDTVELAMPHSEQQTAVSALHHAIVNGSDKSIALLLLANGAADVNHFHNGTPLHLAVTCGRWRIVRLLIDCGADVSFVMPGFGSPLHRAAMLVPSSNGVSHKTIRRIIRLLIRSRVDIDARGAGVDNDRTALHCAATAGNVVAVSELLRFGANLDIQTNSGETALSLATKHNKRDVVCLLLTAAVNVRRNATVIDNVRQSQARLSTN